ncbi:hypothetical protein [Echinicola salinicaeni]|uniref:hypothetical protein n=1 Tax=Echinicola salinicaeni TaxID=2762757 RepID=UPI0016453D56|nr:hypothetical protein [Echinicola salinicaeni]
MKTRECPSCAMEVDAKADLCPICKYEFPKNSPIIQIVAILLVILFVLMYIF